MFVSRLRALAVLATILVGEVVVIGALWALGPGPMALTDLARVDLAVRVTGPVPALVAVGWLGALLGALWLLAATLLDTAAACRAPAGRVTVRPSLPGLPEVLRRRLRHAVAVLMTTSSLAAPAAALAAPGLPAHLPGPGPVEVTRTDPVPDETEPPRPQRPAVPRPPALARSDAPAPPTAEGLSRAPSTAVHRVQAGEHLWAIADRAVREHDPDASTADVAGYWRRLVEANADVPSGDPDLVRPGDTVRLPTI